MWRITGHEWNCTAYLGLVKKFWREALGSEAEGVLVKAGDGWVARAVVDGHDVKPARALFDMSFRKEMLRGANDEMLLFFGRV